MSAWQSETNSIIHCVVEEDDAFKINKRPSKCFGLHTMPVIRKPAFIIRYFSVVLESAFQYTKWENRGISTDEERPSHFRFVDDILLICNSPGEARTMIQEQF